VYCVQLATPFLWYFLPASKEVATVAQSILGLSYYVIWNLLTLMITVMAVRFVASLDLVYDKQVYDKQQSSSENLDFEDLRKYSDRNLKE
jgi:hypothetical protein